MAKPISFPRALRQDLIHCSVTLWPAANTSLSFGLMVRHLLKNKQTELDDSTGDIFESKFLVFDHIALVSGIYNTDMSKKNALLARSSWCIFEETESLKIEAVTAQKKKNSFW